MEKTSDNVTLIIEGTPSPTEPSTPSPELQSIIGKPRLHASYALQPAARGEAVAEIPVQAKDDDLIELHLEGDLRLLMRVSAGKPLMKRSAIATPGPPTSVTATPPTVWTDSKARRAARSFWPLARRSTSFGPSGTRNGATTAGSSMRSHCCANCNRRND